MIPKTDCFIRLNTQELREWMRDVGISMCPCCEFEDAEWLQVGRDGAHSISNEEEALFLFENTKSIDCGTNVNLFKALAAMNDENDYMQWFVDRVGGDDEYDPSGDYGWYLCKDTKLRCAVDCYSKATAEEILKHFP